MPLRPIGNVPQGLKPTVYAVLCGTAEAVPFQSNGFPLLLRPCSFKTGLCNRFYGYNLSDHVFVAIARVPQATQRMRKAFRPSETKCITLVFDPLAYNERLGGFMIAMRQPPWGRDR
jgi:hypothetical protein